MNMFSDNRAISGLKSKVIRSESGLLGDDVLSATDFKPWWETVRSWAMFGLFIVSFLIIYTMKSSTSLSCIPVGNEAESFDELGESNVNLHCAKSAPGGWYLVNMGYLAFAACLVIQILFSWWLFVPRVRFTFKSLKKYDDESSELEVIVDKISTLSDEVGGRRATKEQLDEWIKDENARSELDKKLTSMIRDTNNFQATVPFSVPTIYVIRNLVALIAICLNLYVLYFIIHVREPPFSCALQDIKAECQYDVIQPLLPFLFFGCVLLVFIGLICVVSTLAIACFKRALPEGLEGVDRKTDYAFALYFANHSTPVSRAADTLLKGLAGRIISYEAGGKTKPALKLAQEEFPASQPSDETKPLIEK